MLFVSIQYFNPRSREGSDPCHQINGSSQGHFNPRSREGSDGCIRTDYPDARDFNPRSREGSDGCIRTDYPDARDFNPRSREGSDRGQCSITVYIPVFQSTLPRGERLMDSLGARDVYIISIHAPARGATTDYEVDNSLYLISIHAPARGATQEQLLTML